MEKSMDSQLPEDNQPLASGDELLPPSPPLQGQPLAPRKKLQNPFATRKRTLLSGLALLVLLSASLFAFKALAKSGGIEEWSYQAGGPISSTPTIVNNVIYVVTGDSNVYAIQPPGNTF